jgi:hypothetical protein
MSIYEDFEAAWVDHQLFGNGNARLAAARGRMERDPNYDVSKYREAVFRGEQFVATCRQHMRSARRSA